MVVVGSWRDLRTMVDEGWKRMRWDGWCVVGVVYGWFLTKWMRCFGRVSVEKGGGVMSCCVWCVKKGEVHGFHDCNARTRDIKFCSTRHVLSRASKTFEV